MKEHMFDSHRMESEPNLKIAGSPSGIDLKESLRSKAKGKGALFFGVADLAPAGKFIVEQGGDFLAKYPLALSVGYRLLDGAVDELQKHEDPMTASTYWHHVYQVVNRRLDNIAMDIAQELEQAGHRAAIVPSSYIVDRKSLTGLLSHKLVAHLAGLGWIGKSALLVTLECGPRARWCTVLTDAPLTVDQPFQGEKCGGCTVCVEKCPVQAFTGAAFDVIRPRSELFAAEKCWGYLTQREAVVGCRACGVCVYVCPYGRKKVRPQE